MPQEPPKGFRPAIPLATRFNVILRQEGKCASCGGKIQEWKDVNLDHDPAIQLRIWSEELQDTIPSASDAEHIKAVHKDCHAQKTTGRQGESKLSKRGGDISEIAKLRRLTKKQEEFRQRLLTKGTDALESESSPRKKRAWPKRPFPKRNKEPPS